MADLCKKDSILPNYCCECQKWQYDDYIEKTYGTGTGICKITNEAVGCNRNACLLGIRRLENK